MRFVESLFRDGNAEDEVLWSTCPAPASRIYELLHLRESSPYSSDPEQSLAVLPPDQSEFLPLYLGALLRHYRLAGNIDAARQLFQASEPTARLRTPRDAYLYLQWSLILARHENRPIDALDILLECEHIFRIAELPLALGNTMSIIAGCLIDVGDVRGAVARLMESHETLDAHTDATGGFRSLLTLAGLYLELGCYNDSKAILDQLVERITATTPPPDCSRLYGALTTLSLHREELEQAWHWIDVHDNLARAHNVTSVLTLNAVYRAEVYLRRGDSEMARHVLDTIDVEGGAALSNMPLLLYYLAEARTLRLEGNHGSARDYYLQALDLSLSIHHSHHERVKLFQEILSAEHILSAHDLDEVRMRYIQFLESYTRAEAQSAASILEMRTRHAQRLSELERQQSEAHQREIEQITTAVLKSVASNIHDSVGQSLAIVGLDLDVALASLNPATVLYKRLKTTRTRISGVSRELRDVAHTLSATTLESLGLEAALHSLIGAIDSSTMHSVCTVSLTSQHTPDDQFFMYRCAHILVSNVLRHASATQLSVSLIDSPESVQLLVDDNGIGFNESASIRGMGYRELYARANIRRASIHIDSSPKNGSTIIVNLPLHLC